MLLKRRTTGVLGDVSSHCLKVHSVCYSVWFQRGREVFVFHLLPFISSSLVNWYWGHCLHKPSFPVKREEGGGEERSKKYREKQNIMRKRDSRKKETLHHPMCQSHCGLPIDQQDCPPLELLLLFTDPCLVRPGKSHQLGRISSRR